MITFKTTAHYLTKEDNDPSVLNKPLNGLLNSNLASERFIIDNYILDHWNKNPWLHISEE